MQALVLAGGEGTRLRPLTTTIPKPVLPLAGRPFLSFMFGWLRRHGIDDVVLSCGFLSEDVERVLGHEHEGSRLRYVVEEQPLGTAGPLRFALDEGVLDGGRVLVLNGDVLTDIDLSAQLAQHERTGARATIALTAVEDTASYGVVPTDPAGRVEAFLEKQSGPAPTDRVNAGVYVLEPDVVEGIDRGRAVSMERDVFPALAGEGLYGYLADAYWIDIGTPERYLEATFDLLAGRVESELPPRDETGSLIGEGCLTAGARIGPQSVLGNHCLVGQDASVERSVLHDGVRVGERCELHECIVGEGARLGEGVRVESGAVIGPGARVDMGTVRGDARIEAAGAPA